MVGYPNQGSGLWQALKDRLAYGLVGTTKQGRFVGGTVSGAPTSGSFQVKDFVVDEAGGIYVCTVAGAPGTWVASNDGTYGVLPEAHQDFTGDGTAAATVADSGQTWTLEDNGTANAGLSIISGKLTNTASAASAAAGYAEIELDGNVARIGADFTFAAGTNTGAAALVVWQASVSNLPPPPDSPCHLVITPNGWDFSVYEAGSISSVRSGTFPTPLTDDGATLYRCEVLIDGDTATVSLPDGSFRTITDSRIAAQAGAFACWEVYQSDASTEAKAAFVRVWADDVAAQPGATTSGDIDRAVSLPILLRPTDFEALGGTPSLGKVGTQWPAWLFDAAAVESVVCPVAVPPSWQTFSVDLWWSNAGAGSGDVSWGVDFAQVYDAETLPSLGGTVAIVATAPAQNVADVLDYSVGITITPDQNALLLLRVFRNGTAGGDTLANDAALMGVRLRRLT